MMELLRSIALQNGMQLKSSKTLHGGDSNEAFKVTTESKSYVFKLNQKQALPNLFQAEAHGLETLSKTNSFRIPKVNSVGSYGNHQYLILEWIETEYTHANFEIYFAENLAKLHRNTSNTFGLDHDNYIGSLPQSNTQSTHLVSFYIEQRLLPQLAMAHDLGYSFKKSDRFLKNLEQLLPNEDPALIHGDLWKGNAMVGDNGAPVLIDPSICFASREIDLAMMQLFGGFSKSIFDHYQEIFPCEPNWKDRIPIWQLYYLLVHVNLFGGGYYESAQNIIERYS